MSDYKSISKTAILQPESKHLQAIPTIPEPPIIGSFWRAMAIDSKFRNDARRVHPDISRFHVGPYTFVLVANADLAQEVLLRTEEFDKTPTVTASARPAFGSGILLIENGPHRARRRIIQPAFNHSQVSTYADTISTYATDALRLGQSQSWAGAKPIVGWGKANRGLMVR